MNLTAHSNESHRSFTIILKDGSFTKELVKESILNNSENFNTADIQPAVDLVMKHFRKKGIPNSEYTFFLKFNDVGNLFIFNVCINLNTIK